MMDHNASETQNKVLQSNAAGWRGVIFNICFMLYYYFTWQLVVEESYAVHSYGLSSTLLFSTTLALIVMVSLITEPFVIFYKLSYENYSVQGRALSLPGIFLFVMLVSRFFVRLIFFMAALESLKVPVENGGTGAAIVGTFIFVTELAFVFAITDKNFVGKVRPTLSREIFTRFILLNILMLFTFLFRMFFADMVKGDDRSITWKIIISLILFIAVYLPNIMVQFYGDWRASKTMIQKYLYIVSLGLAFLSIVLF